MSDQRDWIGIVGGKKGEKIPNSTEIGQSDSSLTFCLVEVLGVLPTVGFPSVDDLLGLHCDQKTRRARRDGTGKHEGAMYSVP